jgi:hypothetical protein
VIDLARRHFDFVVIDMPRRCAVDGNRSEPRPCLFRRHRTRHALGPERAATEALLQSEDLPFNKMRFA